MTDHNIIPEEERPTQIKQKKAKKSDKNTVDEKKSFSERMKDAFSEQSIRDFFTGKKALPLLITLASILVLAIAFAIYIGTYYRADGKAILEYTEEYGTDGNITVDYDADGNVVVTPNVIKAGFIFYPGGKVEHTAYLPLMIALGNRGILCVLVDMPCNLAVFDVNKADGIPEQYPEVETWYIGGHSLGGAMAANYLYENTDKLDGIVLLAAYSTKYLANSRAITICGTEDKILNQEKFRKYMPNLPVATEETVIPGGNHAYFGMYGEQRGDGEATITAEDQIERTANTIERFILSAK